MTDLLDFLELLESTESWKIADAKVYHWPSERDPPIYI